MPNLPSGASSPRTRIADTPFPYPPPSYGRHRLSPGDTKGIVSIARFHRKKRETEHAASLSLSRNQPTSSLSSLPESAPWRPFPGQ